MTQRPYLPWTPQGEDAAPGREKQEEGINGPKRDVELRVGPRLLPREPLGSRQSCRDLHTSAYICMCSFSLLVSPSLLVPLPLHQACSASQDQYFARSPQEAHPLQMSSGGPDADVYAYSPLPSGPWTKRPLLDHPSLKAKGSQPLQPPPSGFLLQVPTLSKKEKQIRTQGWRKALEVFDSSTLVVQSRRSTGLDQSLSSQEDWLWDRWHCRGQEFCKGQGLLIKLRAARRQRVMKGKDR